MLYATPGGRDAPPAVRFNDPRRLGRVSLDADLDQLGVEFDAVTPKRLAAAFDGRRGVLKSALLDQHLVAGLGNLCADEVLWWAGLDPRRTVDSLTVGRDRIAGGCDAASAAEDAQPRWKHPRCAESSGSIVVSAVRSRRDAARTDLDRRTHDGLVSGSSTVIRAVSVSSWQNRWSVPAVALPPLVASSPFVGVVGAGDPGSSRLVYAMVIGLVVVGIGLILLAIWILRQTRADLDVLAPLERMGDGDWKKRDPSTQRRMLDDVRPEGAQPLAAEPPPPPLDGDFEQADHAVTSFSDLGPGLGGAGLDTAPAEADTSGTGADSDEPGDDPEDVSLDSPESEPERDPADGSEGDPEGDPAEGSEDGPEDDPAEGSEDGPEGDLADGSEDGPEGDLEDASEGDLADGPEDGSEGDLADGPEDGSEGDLADGPEDGVPERSTPADDPEDESADTSVGDSLSDPRG